MDVSFIASPTHDIDQIEPNVVQVAHVGDLDGQLIQVDLDEFDVDNDGAIEITFTPRDDNVNETDLVNGQRTPRQKVRSIYAPASLTNEEQLTPDLHSSLSRSILRIRDVHTADLVDEASFTSWNRDAIYAGDCQVTAHPVLFHLTGNQTHPDISPEELFSPTTMTTTSSSFMTGQIQSTSLSTKTKKNV